MIPQPARSTLFPYTTLFRSRRRIRTPLQPRKWTLRLVNAIRSEIGEQRLNSSHMSISYAVFCLKKKTLWNAPTLRVATIRVPAHDAHVVDADPLIGGGRARY